VPPREATRTSEAGGADSDAAGFPATQDRRRPAPARASASTRGASPTRYRAPSWHRDDTVTLESTVAPAAGDWIAMRRRALGSRDTPLSTRAAPAPAFDARCGASCTRASSARRGPDLRSRARPATRENSFRKPLDFRAHRPWPLPPRPWVAAVARSPLRPLAGRSRAAAPAHPRGPDARLPHRRGVGLAHALPPGGPASPGTPRPPLGLRVPRAELPDVRDEGAEARRLLLQPRRRPHGRSDGRASGVSPALLPRSDAGRHRVRWHDRLSEPPDRFGAPRRVPGVVSTRAPDVAAARGARHDRPLAHRALLACTRSTARDDSIERRSTTRRGRSSPSRRRSSGTRSPPPPGSSCRHSPR
jgi:hypothetical protein